MTDTTQPTFSSENDKLKWTIARLVAVLELVDRETGWHGRGPKSVDHYYCEHCDADPQLEDAYIMHRPGCLTRKVSAELKKAKEGWASANDLGERGKAHD